MMPSETSGPRVCASVRTRSRASCSRLRCRSASIVSRASLPAGDFGRSPDRPRAAQASASDGGPAALVRLSPTRSHRPARCRSLQTDQARGCALRARPRSIGPADALPREIAAKPPKVPLRRARAGAALCRNRQASGADSLDVAAVGRKIEIERQHLVFASVRVRSRSRARSGEAWQQRLRPLRGSNSRATCMVSVEPPDRIRPLLASWNAARASASGSTP